MGLFLFVIAQLCMMAAAGVVGYIIGRHYEATENSEASGQHSSGPDGTEGREGMEVKPLLLSGGHVAGNTEPYRADKT